MRHDKALKAAGIPYQTVPDVIHYAFTRRKDDPPPNPKQTVEDEKKRKEKEG
jgi:hypothetical protein